MDGSIQVVANLACIQKCVPKYAVPIVARPCCDHASNNSARKTESMIVAVGWDDGFTGKMIVSCTLVAE